MRPQTRLALMLAAFVGVLVLSASLTHAQPGGGGKKGGKGSGTSETVDDFVKKMMAFNAAKDGKLTKKELTDPRLHALFDRADTNKDGVVTRAELEALFTKESLANTGGGGGKGGDGGGGKGDGKKGGKKGPPQPGQILPPFLQEALNLTDGQKKQVADLQKDADTKLNTILTAEQRTQLREMREKGPGGFGPPPGDKKGPPPPDKQ